MNKLKNVFFSVFFVMFAQGCATVGTVIDGGQKLATDTIDTVTGTASGIVGSVANDVGSIVQTGAEVGVGLVQTAADTGAGLVKVVADEVNDQTNALQDDKEESEEETKK
jgi:hypothetical protein|tara:strand:+ start:1319 stop:1648 length:330 start_codon:yes stop_codon:yes gene_type:complete